MTKILVAFYALLLNIFGINQQQDVPVFTAENLIRNFASAIDNGRIPEAVDLLDSNLKKDDSSVQMWGIQFNAFENFDIVNLEKIDNSYDENFFKVIFDVKLKPDIHSVAIPNYGWENGENIRWIRVVKDTEGFYKILNINTGP